MYETELCAVFNLVPHVSIHAYVHVWIPFPHLKLNLLKTFNGVVHNYIFEACMTKDYL